MSESTEPNLNGWQNIGKVLIWSMGRLQGNQQTVYMAIVRKSVGYAQYTTELLSYQYLANYTGLSIASIKRIVPELIAKQYIIKIATNQLTDTGKLPYKYQLNMKLPDFPSLGKLRKHRDEPIGNKPTEPTFVCPPVESYFVHGKSVLEIANPINQTKYDLLSNTDRLVHPTIEQLTNHLKD